MFNLLTVGRYKEHCSMSETSCYSPLSCASGLCECEPNHFYKTDHNTCNTCKWLLQVLK